MLLTLLIWLYCTLITFVAGDILLRVGNRWFGPLPVLATPMVCLLGAASLTVLLGWAWLIIPISLTTHLALALGLIGYAVWQRPRPDASLPRWKNQWLGWGTVSVLVTVVWLRSVQLPRLTDTGGYHAPMIEWIHQYAVVPGLANLNYRFGFNNAWFLLNAFFRFQLTPDVPWHGLNGWILLMVGWFSLTEWHRRQHISHYTFSSWLGGWLAVGFLLIFHWTLSSPSPDLPTHIYIALSFWIWLRRAEPDQAQYGRGWAWLLIVFSLSALTTKLSAVTLLLLPALVVGKMILRKDWPGLLAAVATLLFVTGYWWGGNVLLSGYVAYPSLSPLVDWFSVDWKVPATTIAVGLKNLQQGTRGDLGPTFSLAWVPVWFPNRPALEQGILLALLPVPALVLWQRNQLFRAIPGYGAALLTAGIGVVFWFLLAPEIRFGAGSVLVLLGLGYGPSLSRAPAWLIRMQALVLSLTGLIGLGLLLAAIRRQPVDWLLPAGYPDSPLRTYTVGEHTVLYPTDDARVINGIRGYWGDCYDAALPCSPYPIPGLNWRGQTLERGFRTRQSNSR